MRAHRTFRRSKSPHPALGHKPLQLFLAPEREGNQIALKLSVEHRRPRALTEQYRRLRLLRARRCSTATLSLVTVVAAVAVGLVCANMSTSVATKANKNASMPFKY